jgi:putative ABC transport system permease protein
MLPTVDSMKTLGIVQLPGMMTGLILAGLSPAIAIKYQIMVTFMLAGAVTITAFSASLWAFRSFFNAHSQLR